MTHRSRPRVHLLTGGPDWEQRQATVKSVPFSRRQKEARKPLLALFSLSGPPMGKDEARRWLSLYLRQVAEGRPPWIQECRRER
ncbi:hypothetical protein [Streptomyces sp. NPDC048584]|uniref:hypothetical protein n=1 Tax=Streptomyces sp. NPDC048584 TaxID=3365573 RepID=UPI00371255CA